MTTGNNQKIRIKHSDVDHSSGVVKLEVISLPDGLWGKSFDVPNVLGWKVKFSPNLATKVISPTVIQIDTEIRSNGPFRGTTEPEIWSAHKQEFAKVIAELNRVYSFHDQSRHQSRKHVLFGSYTVESLSQWVDQSCPSSLPESPPVPPPVLPPVLPPIEDIIFE